MMTKYKCGKSDKLLQEIDDNCDINDTSIAAKIKRLKIEESHLLKTLNSTAYTSDSCIKDSKNSDFHKFTSKLKELYENINILFEDIKGGISSQEAIRSLDINEIEGNICELEQKIKYIKNYIESELPPLKMEEKKLIEKLKQDPPEIRIKSVCNTQGLKYKEIVPSPVRTLITSSLKSSEVQEFQDFISNSPNRFGGWNEYYHNIFAACWRKYFRTDCSGDIESFVIKIEKSEVFQSFLQELHQKLKCFKSDDIISHCKWYSKYMYLKERQQMAIDKWKTNKILIKKSTFKVNQNNEIRSRKSMSQRLPNQEQNEENRHQMNKHKAADCGNDKHLPRLQYNKPTKQWSSRCQIIENSSNVDSSNVENLSKL